MFFEPLRKIADFFINLDRDQLIFELSNNREFKELVVKLNTEKQLFDKGINSEGVRLDVIGGPYAPFTVERKKELGQPY